MSSGCRGREAYAPGNGPCDTRCDLIWFFWPFENFWPFVMCISYVFSVGQERTSPPLRTILNFLVSVIYNIRFAAILRPNENAPNGIFRLPGDGVFLQSASAGYSQCRVPKKQNHRPRPASLVDGINALVTCPAGLIAGFENAAFLAVGKRHDLVRLDVARRLDLFEGSRGIVYLPE